MTASPSESTLAPPIGLSHHSGARAAAYPHGAHIVTWWPSQGTEVLFVSEKAVYQPDAAIRGGVPIIFPQFADQGPLPKHGFARTARWDPMPRDAMTVLSFRLRDTDETRALWPYAFEAQYRVTLDEHSLTMELSVASRDERPFGFTVALHTYLRVADVRNVVVRGLRGCRYLDKQQGGAERREEEERLTIEGPVDRIYVDVAEPVVVEDPGLDRSVTVESTGFRDVVLWNPWETGAAALPDMTDGEYTQMLCVESAVAEEPVWLEPRREWAGRTTLKMRRRADETADA